MATETVFTYGAPSLKFGAGAADEVGFDVGRLGARRVLLVTDPGVAATGAADRVAGSLRGCGIHVEMFTGVHVEPTDTSFKEAIAVATEGGFDGYVGVGGGSSMDTAAVNMISGTSRTGSSSHVACAGTP